MVWNIPFTSWGQLSWLHLLPNFSSTPSSLDSVVVWEAEKALALCNPAQQQQKTSLYYPHDFQHKAKTQPLWRKLTLPATLKKINFTPAKNSTQLLGSGGIPSVITDLLATDLSTRDGGIWQLCYCYLPAATLKEITISLRVHQFDSP